MFYVQHFFDMCLYQSIEKDKKMFNNEKYHLKLLQQALKGTDYLIFQWEVKLNVAL